MHKFMIYSSENIINLTNHTYSRQMEKQKSLASQLKAALH